MLLQLQQMGAALWLRCFGHSLLWFSLVVELGFSSCCSWALQCWLSNCGSCTQLSIPENVESSRTRIKPISPELKLDSLPLSHQGSPGEISDGQGWGGGCDTGKLAKRSSSTQDSTPTTKNYLVQNINSSKVDKPLVIV